MMTEAASNITLTNDELLSAIHVNAKILSDATALDAYRVRPVAPSLLLSHIERLRVFAQLWDDAVRAKSVPVGAAPVADADEAVREAA